MRVRTYWFSRVFYEAARDLDSQPPLRNDHVEACRPQGFLLSMPSLPRRGDCGRCGGDRRLNENDAAPSHLGCSPPPRLREESPWLQSGGPRNPWASLSAARFRVEGQLRWAPHGGQEPPRDEAASSADFASELAILAADADHRAPGAALLAPVGPRALRAAQRRSRGRALPQRRRARSRAPRATSCSTPSRPTGSSAGSACGAPRRARTPTTCLGFVGLAVPSFLPSVLPAVEVGWRLARPAWGRGLATEGARASLRHAFGELDLEAVISIIDPANERSIRVAEKLGMRRGRRSRAPSHAPPIARVRDFFARCGIFTRALLTRRESARIRSVQTRNRAAESEALGLRGPPL